MFKDKIKILLVDDDRDEYFILKSLLGQIWDMTYHLEWTDKYENALRLMVENQFDIYLLDYRLGKENGVELMKEALNNGCNSPVILLTGQGEREIDMAAMKAGASDYLLKNHMDAHFLERSIRYAIERKKAQLALLESENRYRDLLENANDMILNLSKDGAFLYANKHWMDKMNLTSLETQAMTIYDIIHPDYIDDFRKDFEKLLSGNKTDLLETAFMTKDGLRIDTQGNINIKYDDVGNIISLRAIFRDITARKKAERERDRIFELSKDLIAILNFNLEFIDFSPSWSNVLKYNSATIKGLNLDELVYHEDLSLLQKIIKKLKKGIPVSSQEIRLKNADYEFKWFSLSIASEPKEKLIYVIARDITENKQSQIELRESEKRYRDLIEYNRGLIFTHDLNGIILSANKAVSLTLGYPLEDIVGQHISRFFYPEDKVKLNRYLASTRKNKVVHGTIEVKNKSDQLITLTYQNFRHKAVNNKEYIIGNAQDITDRVRAEEALMREREQLLDTIENAPVPMAMLDRDMRFITCSKQWMQEYKPTHVDTVIGKTYFELYPWIGKKWVEYSQKVLNGSVISKSEDILELPNETRIYFRWAMHPWKDVKGNVNGVIMVAERIDDLVKARDAAETANRTKSTFLANVTHELRTPLNAILGYAQILAKDKTITEYQKDYINNMYRSGMHLLSMINDILDLSKIEAGKSEVNLDDINLYDLLDEIYGLFVLKSKEKGIELRLKKSEELPKFVRTDISKLRQILINIIGNSLKYTEKGNVTIRVYPKISKDNPDLIPITFSIKDTGRGIPKYQIEEIFKPFSQVKGDHNQGTGLGLTISKSLAQLLGGTIELESEWRVGSEFKLHLPLKPVNRPKKHVKSKFSNVKGIAGKQQYKVLIVDDVDYNRTVLRVMLQQVGFECYEAPDGKSAIEYCQENKPDIIFIDKHLPDMSGIEVQKRVRKNAKLSNTVIFALTASGIGDSRLSYIKQGFNDFLRKPFTEEEIFELIQQYTNIEYIYDNRETVNDKKSLKEIIDDTIIELDKLPEDLKQHIKEALEWQDFDELKWLVSGIEKNTGEENPAAVHIKNAVNRSDYYFITMLNKSMEI